MTSYNYYLLSLITELTALSFSPSLAYCHYNICRCLSYNNLIGAMAALLACLVLILAMAGHSNAAVYCLCKGGVGQSSLQKALDYACGAGADCSAILQNKPCYNPNTVKNHCDYAVNSYFHRKGQVNGSCDFNGAAATSSTLPTQSSGCTYQSTPGSTSPIGLLTPPSGTGLRPTGYTDNNAAALTRPASIHILLSWILSGLLLVFPRLVQ